MIEIDNEKGLKITTHTALLWFILKAAMNLHSPLSLSQTPSTHKFPSPLQS